MYRMCGLIEVHSGHFSHIRSRFYSTRIMSGTSVSWKKITYNFKTSLVPVELLLLEQTRGSLT